MSPYLLVCGGGLWLGERERVHLVVCLLGEQD